MKLPAKLIGGLVGLLSLWLWLLSGCAAAPSSIPSAIPAPTPSSKSSVDHSTSSLFDSLLAAPKADVPLPARTAGDDTLVVNIHPDTNKPFNSFVRWPKQTSPTQAVQVVVLLHGIGGDCKAFAEPLLKDAEQNGWLVVAPQIDYGNWHDAEEVAREDIENSFRLIATLNQLTPPTGYTLKHRVLLYGFSRGAQFAHRFAMFFPERVERVAIMSAGTYTLPQQRNETPGDGRLTPLKFPYGLSDIEDRLGRSINRAEFKRIQFWVGVGENDNVQSDVPRAWDPYLGRTRLERAKMFCHNLAQIGIVCQTQVFPNVGHAISSKMLSHAIAFLRDGVVPSKTAARSQ